MSMPPSLAAVIFDSQAPVDDLIAEALRPLQGRGILGFLQGYQTPEACACGDIVLTSLHDGAQKVITQDLGPGATGCRLDGAALADVAGELMAGLMAGPALVVLNRFGKTEAEGGGLRQVLEAALDRGIPVLVPVNRKHLSFWQDYASDLAVTLPTDEAAIAQWVEAHLSVTAAG